MSERLALIQIEDLVRKTLLDSGALAVHSLSVDFEDRNGRWRFESGPGSACRLHKITGKTTEHTGVTES